MITSSGRSGEGLTGYARRVADASAGLLEQLGYTVRWASDAETALAEIVADGIDLVFSDIIMPGKMDGLKLARAIRERNPTLPILLTTGYSESAKHVRSDFPVLRKPYQLHELSRELSKLTTDGRRPTPNQSR